MRLEECYKVEEEVTKSEFRAGNLKAMSCTVTEKFEDSWIGVNALNVEVRKLGERGCVLTLEEGERNFLLINFLLIIFFFMN